MSTDYIHHVTVFKRQGASAFGEKYRADGHRVEGGALVLQGGVEQLERFVPDAADECIIPLDMIAYALVDYRERPAK